MIIIYQLIIQLIDTIYKGKNICQLIIDSFESIYTIQCWFPTDISPAEDYWIKKEKETYQLTRNFHDYIFGSKWNKEQLLKFIKKYNFNWSNEFVDTIIKCHNKYL